MLKVGFALNIGICGCDDRVVVKFECLEKEDLENPGIKKMILDHAHSEAEDLANSYGYEEEEEGVFVNDEGDEADPEATAYWLATEAEEEDFIAGLDNIGQIIS